MTPECHKCGSKECGLIVITDQMAERRWCTPCIEGHIADLEQTRDRLMKGREAALEKWNSAMDVSDEYYANWQNCKQQLQTRDDERDGLKEQIDFLNSRLDADIERCPICKMPMTAENGTCSSAHYPLQIRHANKAIQARDEALEKAKVNLIKIGQQCGYAGVPPRFQLIRKYADNALRAIEAKGD